MQPIRIHHVQITVTAQQVEAARAFYCDVLGLREVEKPDSLKARGGFWLEIGQQQVHVGVEDKAHKPQTKAHIAYQVEQLAAWREHLSRAGIEIIDSIPIPGFERFEFRDPFGNRIEMIRPQHARVQRLTAYSGSPWEHKVGYARAVRMGAMVYVSGTTASGPDGEMLGTTAAEQTRAILQKIQAALHELGAALHNVVRTRMFVVDIQQHWQEIGVVHNEFFGDIHPVATMVEVSQLIDPAFLVEIEVDAQLES